MAPNALPSYPNIAYTIGWVCALPIEMAAAKGMLDELHANPQTPPSQTDTNSYLLGKIHGHNVVIACLPRDEMGPASAALVAAHMLSTFPSIEVGLSVGIGSGIPHYGSDDIMDGEDIKDIRLGDVVVASDAKTGGLVAYNSGKRHADGSFEVRNAMGRPPRALRAALSRFEMERMWSGGGISENIARMLERYPALRRRGFEYPQDAEDVLFDEDSCHMSRKTGTRDKGDWSFVKDRPSRVDTEPVIHYGTVATGSEIVSHAPTRERIREEHGAVCIDKGAAGLMNYFPCLVIRGISDYADSHKNDRWKAYAAATAAACAKELLEYVPAKAGITKGIQDEARPELLRKNLEETFASTDATMVAAQEGNFNSKILSWIAELASIAQQNYLLERRKDSITMPMLQYHMFQRWVGQPRKGLDLSHAGNRKYGMTGRFLHQHRYSSRRDREIRGSLAPVIESVKQSFWSGLWTGGLSNGVGTYESKEIGL